MLKDLDGDKVDDIVVSNNGRSRIDLLLSTKKPDDDQSNRPFRKDPNDLQYDRRMRLASIPVNKEVVSLDTGDFNGDGKPDLVFYGTPAEVEILFNEGPGRFGNPKKISTGEGAERASALTVGDLDQDGRDDIVLLGRARAGVRLPDRAGDALRARAGAPHRRQSLAGPGPGHRRRRRQGPGRPRHRHGDHPIHIRFATPEKKLGPEQRFAVEVPRAIAFGQMDGQPGSEILTIESQSGRARVLTLDRSGTDESNKRGRLAFFAPAAGQRAGPVAGPRRPGRRRPAGRRGHRPVQRPGLGLSCSRADRAWAPARPSPAWSGARTVHLADLDGDRKDEVYVLSDQEKQIGQSEFARGRLSFPTPLPITGEPVAMDLADLDGDKTPEILYVARHQARHRDASSCAHWPATSPDRSARTSGAMPRPWRCARRQGGPRRDRVR